MAINQQDSKIIIKSSTVTGEVPTNGPSSDHTDGSWVSTDLYSGEMMFNLTDNRAWFRSLYYKIGIATINGTAPLTADRVAITDSSGHITTSSMTATELASLSSGSTTISGTYAYWSARKTAGTLPINKRVFVSDKSVYLFCATATDFDLKGVWKNTVSGVDYYNDCGYVFADDFFTFIYDDN